MEKKQCILKEFGHIGIIKRETDTYYGIYWLDGRDGKEYAERINKIGLPTYWQNKNNIKIINL